MLNKKQLKQLLCCFTQQSSWESVGGGEIAATVTYESRTTDKSVVLGDIFGDNGSHPEWGGPWAESLCDDEVAERFIKRLVETIPLPVLEEDYRHLEVNKDIYVCDED